LYSVENSLWRRLWNCRERERECVINDDFNSEVNSVRKHNYNCMLDDDIY